MNRRFHCPECTAYLQEKLVGDALEPGRYTTVWECPNVVNHGTTVECQNCGEQVRHPNEHWHSIEGLIGSGKWVCLNSRVMDAFKESMKRAAEGGRP
jgi:hypothetical protein